MHEKSGTAYEETLHVPMIVYDPSGRFTAHSDVIRPQLTSNIDLLPMFATIANNGSTSWMKGEYEALYSTRYNMLPLLKDPTVPGRSFSMYATDELYFSSNLPAPYHLASAVTATTTNTHLK